MPANEGSIGLAISIAAGAAAMEEGLYITPPHDNTTMRIANSSGLY
jgi:hypothetical protein